MSIVFWLFGLPSSGKTTLSKALHKKFMDKGYIYVEHLDGDEMRKTLCKDLGFTDEDRKKNIERVAHVVNILSRNGVIVIASFITPTNEIRKIVKDILKDKVMFIYIRCPINVCINRDVKGLYKKALNGEIENFTGISAPFEEPDFPVTVVDSDNCTVEMCVDEIFSIYR